MDTKQPYIVLKDYKIYYITRSYPGYISTGGGTIMRKSAVDELKLNGLNVWVVCPNPNSSKVEIDEKDQIISIPYNKSGYNIEKIKEHLGLISDYHDSWALKTINYLKDHVQKKDILFSTIGGGLATLKIGSVLKNEIGCKLVVNFRDPINHSTYNGLKSHSKVPHVNRNRYEKKYLNNVDLIITSSKTFQIALSDKYPSLKPKIRNNSFGYIQPINTNHQKKNNHNELNIVYGGMFSDAQKPQLLIPIVNNSNYPKRINLTYIGDFPDHIIKEYKSEKVHFKPKMNREDFCKYLDENIDVAFVSLYGNYYKYCVPSKIYENINLNLPMLGALHRDSEAASIINNNQFGISCHFSDEKGLKQAINELCDQNKLDQFKSNIANQKTIWSMQNKIKEVVNWINDLSAT